MQKKINVLWGKKNINYKILLTFLQKESKKELSKERRCAKNMDLEGFSVHHNRFLTLTEMWKVTLDEMQTWQLKLKG
jgi:hypothetical protein